jgi:predicted kinase
MILYIMSGLPGSGKSTTANEIVENTGAILVSRDELRVSYRNLPDESHLSQALGNNVKFFLERGYDVVVDSWNLEVWDEKLWTEMARRFGATLSWKHIDTDVETCVARDAKRPQPIGAESVRNAAERYSERLKVLEEG